jgi:hydroxypyruvate isomerase
MKRVTLDGTRRGEGVDGVEQPVRVARVLGTPQLNCLAGKAPAGVPDAVLRATFVDNLKFAAAALKAEGRRLLVEPINAYDIPGFYLLDEVGAAHAFVQFDRSHAQRTEGELNWRFLFDEIDRLGYPGWIGCEYKSATTATEAGLGWRQARAA